MDGDINQDRDTCCRYVVNNEVFYRKLSLMEAVPMLITWRDREVKLRMKEAGCRLGLKRSCQRRSS